MGSKPLLRKFNKAELEDFRGKLERRKKELLGLETDVEEEGLTGLSDETTDEISHVRTHAADVGSNEFEQELMLHLADEEIREIQDIEDALTKIQNETYGVCQECGREIPFVRLEAVPYTRYCGPCEVKLEKERRQRRGGSSGRADVRV